MTKRKLDDNKDDQKVEKPAISIDNNLSLNSDQNKENKNPNSNLFGDLNLNFLHITGDQKKVDLSKPSKIEYEMKCPICLEDIPKLEGDYELSNPLFYENGLFKCPQEKHKSYCYKCIDILYKNLATSNPNAIVSCPCCRTNLRKSIEIYRENFIEKFINNPKKEMVDILKLILSDFDGSTIFETKLIDDIQFCKNISKLIKNLPGKNVDKIRKVLRKKIVSMKSSKFSSLEFKNFCFELEENPSTVHSTLQKNSKFIESLTTLQISELIETIIFEIKFVEKSHLIDSMNVLFDLINDEDLVFENEEKYFKILLNFLNSKTMEGLEHFRKLNNNMSVKNASYSIDKIFESFNSISNLFESDILFFEVCKDFVHKISKNKDELKKNILKLPPNLILKKEFDFLVLHFTENVIFQVVEEFLEITETFKRAVNFLFGNNLFAKYPDMLEIFVGNFLISNFSTLGLTFRERFEYFLAKLIYKTNFVNELDDCTIRILIKNCVGYKLSVDFLKPFEKFIDKNLFTIVKYMPLEFIQQLFKMLNELKDDNKADYQRFDFSSDLFFDFMHLEILEKILLPKSLYPCLKIIFEASKNFTKICNNNGNKLKYLIEMALRCSERRELLEILSNSLPKESKFLVKVKVLILSLDAYNKLSCNNYTRNPSKIQVMNDMKKYLLENSFVTPTLKKKIGFKDFDVLNYICLATNTQENLAEIRLILARVETSCLIDYYEKLTAPN